MDRPLARKLVALLVVGSIAGMGVACGDDDATASDPRDEPSTQPQAATAEPTCEDGTLQDRGFILCTAGATSDQLLIVALHGRGSSGQEMQASTQLERAAAAEGVAVVFPEAGDDGWADDTFTTPSRPRGNEDVRFLDDLIAEMRSDPRLTDGPVGVVGFSNGASMALRYAVERPNDVRAVAAVAGQLPRDPAISPSQPVPLLSVYGTADPVRSWDAGIPDNPDRQPGDPTPTLSTAESVAAFVATMDDAVPERPSESDPEPADGTSLRTERWVGTDETVVVMHSIVGGGHTWPSAHTAPTDGIDFGPVSQDLDASAHAIAFILNPRQ